MPRALLAVAFVGLVAAKATSGQELSRDPELPAPLERRSLVSAVLDRNPSLEAVRQAWQALQQRDGEGPCCEG